jgi:hypothetical protein
MATNRRPVLLLLSSAFVALVGCDHREDCDHSSGTKCAHTVADAVVVDAAVVGNDTSASGTDTAGADTSPTPQGMAAQSSKGGYNLWFVLPAAVPVGQAASVQVTVQDTSGAAVTGLALIPKYIHITMGHGGSKLPVATEVGAGIYTVTNLVASMPGEWSLSIALPGGDSAAQSWQVAK